MKFICDRVELANNISIVSRAVSSRPTHPVLGNILIEAKDNQVILTGFDLTLGITSIIDAQVIEDGKITVPSRLFADLITKSQGEEICLNCDLDTENKDEDDNSSEITITSGNGKFNIRGLSASEFPELPTIESNQAIELSKNQLLQGLIVTIASSNDETKQILTGVHCCYAKGNIEFASTDGHRLAVTSFEDENNSQEFAVTIPARSLRDLEKMMGNSESVECCFDKNQMVFKTSKQNLTTRILEGSYPVYNQLIPTQFSRTAILDRKKIINSVELVSVLAEQKNNVVKFSFNADNQDVSLSVRTQGVGSATEVLSCQFSGDNIDIAFNVKYLLEGLKTLNTTEIQMQFNEANQPLICTPLGGFKFTYLLMPIQIRD